MPCEGCKDKEVNDDELGYELRYQAMEMALRSFGPIGTEETDLLLSRASRIFHYLKEGRL